VLRLISSPNFENLIFILVSNIPFIVRRALVRKRLELLDVLLILMYVEVWKFLQYFYSLDRSKLIERISQVSPKFYLAMLRNVSLYRTKYRTKFCDDLASHLFVPFFRFIFIYVKSTIHLINDYKRNFLVTITHVVAFY